MVGHRRGPHDRGMNENPSTLPPTTPGPRRLLRSADDKMIAGVASGIARHFAVEPAFVRLGFVALAMFGGSGLLLYAVAWIIVPSDQNETDLEHEVVAADPEADDVPPPFTVYPMV